MLLSIDISTSCTGWAVWSPSSKSLIAAGAIETSSKKFPDLFSKMDYVIDQIEKICEGYKIETIAAEAALQKVSGGKTTAATMFALIGFNFCLCYSLTRKFKCQHIMLNVRSARKNLGIVIPKGAKDKKIYVIQKMKPLFPQLNWALKKTGKHKDWVGDMADALVIGLNGLDEIAKKI